MLTGGRRPFFSAPESACESPKSIDLSHPLREPQEGVTSSLPVTPPLVASRSVRGGSGRYQELLAIADPAVVFPLGHFLWVGVRVAPCDPAAPPDLRTANASNIVTFDTVFGEVDLRGSGLGGLHQGLAQSGDETAEPDLCGAGIEAGGHRGARLRSEPAQ